MYINNNYEQVTVIKKLYNQHWIFEGISSEFKVCSKNTWEPHPTNIKLENLPLVHSNYKILAESNRGPQVAIHEYSICVQFDITAKYPESSIILFNFLKKYMNSIYVSLS